MNSAAEPFVVFGGDVFGQEIDVGIASEEFLCIGAWGNLCQGEVRAAVRRADFNPADALDLLIDDDAEAELVHVEAQAAFLIADKDHDEVEAKVRVLPVQAQKETIHPER